MKLGLALLLLSIAAPLAAQTGVRPPQGWSLGVFGGGAAFTDFQRVNVHGIRLSGAGELEERQIARYIGAETSGAIAATLAFWPSKNWGVRARGLYAPTRFETVFRKSDAAFMNAPQTSEETGELAALAISSLDGQILFRLPTIRGRIMPYGIVGGGAVRYAHRGGNEPVPDEAADDFGAGRSQTRLAGSFGLGAMIGLRPERWGLHFELTDQISRTPVEGTSNDRIRSTSSVTFMVGASWRFAK